VIISQKDYLVW